MSENLLKKDWKSEACTIETEILRYEEKNRIYPEGNFKNIFYCRSKTNPQGRMCIYWSRMTAEPGDKVILTGRSDNDIFLVWKLTVLKS